MSKDAGDFQSPSTPRRAATRRRTSSPPPPSWMPNSRAASLQKAIMSDDLSIMRVVLKDDPLAACKHLPCNAEPVAVAAVRARRSPAMLNFLLSNGADPD